MTPAVIGPRDAGSGERRWVGRYDTGSDDRAIALALGDERTGMGVADLAVGGGRAYAVGSSSKKKWPDYLVRSYAATGDLNWEERFDLGKRDESAHAAAWASGRLVTAGGGKMRGTGSNSWVLVRTYDAR